MAEKTSHKPRSYLARRLIKTGQEIEVVELIPEIAGGIVIAFAAWKFGMANRTELPELFFLCVGGAIIGAIVGFLIRFTFITPAKMHRELEEEINVRNSSIENLNADIQKIKGSMPVLELLPALAERDIDGKFFCRINVKNRSKTGTARLVKVELVSIEPTPVLEGYSLITGDVPYPIKLRSSEPEGATIHPGGESKFDVFAINRSENTFLDGGAVNLSVYFVGRPRFVEEHPDVPRFRIGGFKPEQKNKPESGFKDYSIRIRISAEGFPAYENIFTVFFVKDMAQDAVQISGAKPRMEGAAKWQSFEDIPDDICKRVLRIKTAFLFDMEKIKKDNKGDTQTLDEPL